MNRLEELEAEIVQRSRRAYSASPSSESRVRAAALAAIGAGAMVPNADPTQRWRDAIDRMRDGLSVTRVVALALALGGAGAGGYALGLREGRVRSSVDATPARMSVAPAPVATPPDRGKPEELLVAPEPPRARQPSSEAETRAPIPSARSAPPAELELDTLRRVERALRQGNPRFALGLLIELDRKLPRGALMEERLAARATASCQVEKSAAARKAAAVFDSRYPNSVYAARVREACAVDDRGAGERIDEPAETHVGKGELTP
jgi:hypothetical protein